MFVVYVLSCSDASYHVGITKDITARMAYYNSDKNEGPIKNRLPVQLLSQVTFNEIEDAIAHKEKLSALSDNALETHLKNPETEQIQTKSKSNSKNNSIRIILPTSYFGNVSYFEALASASELIIDIHDRYEKQTYRNRCTILSANGLLNLTVPVNRPNGKNTLVKEVIINYDENWQKDHIKAIESAYRSAPFYDFFAKDLIQIIKSRQKYLVDLNIELTQFISQSLGLKIDIKKGTESDSASIPSKIALLPKERENHAGKSYQQVFLLPDQFEGNLSSLDLLFNCGKKY